MAARRGRRGVSKAQWLEAGLEALAEGGVSAVTIGGLSRSLHIARAGFYWHFKDRSDLLDQMLRHWSHELTEVISDNPEIAALEPVGRLRHIAEMVLEYDLAAYELAIRQWALNDGRAARAVRRVNRKRLDSVRAAFAELGFEGDDLEMRTMLFVAYHSFEAPMFREISRKRRRGLIERRIELLTRA
ncbi:MAG: TetR/AcrR family transcriptional regulator [Deltaproteobacteria bacterium]|nr:TetR/AcrR family transcriptional regulator [Deltaproteobacteria bacterium]